jgi:hypothetical protein
MIEVKKDDLTGAEERQAGLENPGQADTYRNGPIFAKQIHAHVSQADAEAAARQQMTGRRPIPQTSTANARAPIVTGAVTTAQAPQPRPQSTNRRQLNVETAQTAPSTSRTASKKPGPDEAPSVSTG